MNIKECIQLAKGELMSSKNKVLTIILDAAHGEEVPGKRSPDGLFREYKWSRDIIALLIPRLESLGYTVYQTNETNKEIGLSKRKNIATSIKGDNKVLLSIHNNAAGNGSQWLNATGFEFFTTTGQTKSDIFAECLVRTFKQIFPEERMRVDEADGDSDKESNFTVLMGSGYTAVLAECLFQDNKKDVEKLNSRIWCEKCVTAFVKAIEFYNWIIVNHS